MNKLVRIIESMDKEDLKKIKMDLEEGNIRRLINKRMGELDDENKVCPVCSKPVKSSDYVLEFGQLGLRMKASFDAIDCLKHFVNNFESSGPSDA